MAMGIFNFPLVFLVQTPLKVVAFLCSQMSRKPKTIIFLPWRSVARLLHDNNCYTRRLTLPKHLHLQFEQLLVNSMFGCL